MDDALQKRRAGEAWPILVKLARQGGKPVTYGKLCSLMPSRPFPRVARHFLSRIQEYCKANRLPRLQGLVVSQGKAGDYWVPGPGYNGSRTEAGHRRDIAAVYAYGSNWPSSPPRDL
jgi:hypothetical protein